MPSIVQASSCLFPIETNHLGLAAIVDKKEIANLVLSLPRMIPKFNTCNDYCCSSLRLIKVMQRHVSFALQFCFIVRTPSASMIS